MRVKLIYIATLILSLATACSEPMIGEDEGSSQSHESTSEEATVNLCAVMDSYELTRAGKEQWVLGDKIDVACEASALLSYNLAIDFVEYSVSDISTGELTPTDDTLHYMEGVNNSYFALHPTGLIEAGSNNFQVDLTDQRDGCEELDLLYATTIITGQTGSDNSLSLNFTHQYAIVTFDFVSSSDDSTIAEADLFLRGAYSKAQFDVISGTFKNQEVANIAMKIDESTMSSSVLVLPWQNMSNIELVVYHNGMVRILKPDIVDEDGSMVVWRANKQYKYRVNL